jgi:hypothetical protein
MSTTHNSTPSLPLDKVKTAFREVYKQKKFLVIGQPITTRSKFSLGDTVDNVAGYPLGPEFEIFEEATLEQWNEQTNFIANLQPSWTRTPTATDGFYWKIRAIKKAKV